MKRIISISVLALCCAVAAAQPFDVSAWDESGIPGYDSVNNLRFTLKADPKTGDLGFLVHTAMQGYIWVLQDIYVRSARGECFVGNRGIKDGRSQILYREIACYQFDAMHQVWKQAVGQFLKRSKSGPLDGSS